MTPREWLTLALRVLGFWVLISAVSTMAMLVGVASQSNGLPIEMLLTSGMSVLAYAGLASVLLLFAPWIADRFDRSTPPVRETTASPITLADVYQIAARVLGVYSIYEAIGPLGHLIQQVWRSSFGGIPSGDLNWAYAVQIVTYLVCAAVLIVRADLIATLFVRTHRSGSDAGPRRDESS